MRSMHLHRSGPRYNTASIAPQNSLKIGLTDTKVAIMTTSAINAIASATTERGWTSCDTMRIWLITFCLIPHRAIGVLTLAHLSSQPQLLLVNKRVLLLNVVFWRARSCYLAMVAKTR